MSFSARRKACSGRDPPPSFAPHLPLTGPRCGVRNLLLYNRFYRIAPLQIHTACQGKVLVLCFTFSWHTNLAVLTESHQKDSSTAVCQTRHVIGTCRTYTASSRALCFAAKAVQYGAVGLIMGTTGSAFVLCLTTVREVGASFFAPCTSPSCKPPPPLLFVLNEASS